MLSKKVTTITPSFTIGISTKVKELIKSGEQITNLSIGEPDFMTPDNAKEAAIEAINANKTKYDAASGLNELKDAIVNKLDRENGISYTKDQIVVSSGAKHAITNTLIALTDPGDEVIIPKPFWVSYPEMVKLTGGTPVFVETSKENSFKLTLDQLKGIHTEKSKILFITNPSNPTGAVYTKEELAPIVDYCIEHNIYIIADEIYERICYNDAFTAIASLSPEAKAITITINGLSKSAAMTGWRLGYTASNTEIAKAISSIQGHLVSHPSTITQWAALEALTNCEDDIKKMISTYKGRRELGIKMFDEIPELDIVTPDGAFYLFIDFSKIKDKVQYKDSFSIELCNILLDKYKLAIVPGIAFGIDDYARISYAASTDEICEGIEKIKAFLKDINA